MTNEKHKIPGKPCFLDMFLEGGQAKSAGKICNDLAKILESLWKEPILREKLLKWFGLDFA